jgi:hypothetical protein
VALKILPQLFVKQKSRRIFKNDLSNSKVQILVLLNFCVEKKVPLKESLERCLKYPCQALIQSAGYLEKKLFYLNWLAVVKGVVCY